MSDTKSNPGKRRVDSAGHQVPQTSEPFDMQWTRYIVLIVTVVLAGCGDDRLKTVPVTGTVTFPDGTPVRTGTIEFESTTHEVTATGAIQTDGRFVLGTYETADGAVPGDHRVIVLQMIINDGTVDHTMDHGSPVAPHYASYESSGLTATVEDTAGNDLTVEVTAASEN